MDKQQLSLECLLERCASETASRLMKILSLEADTVYDDLDPGTLHNLHTRAVCRVLFNVNQPAALLGDEGELKREAVRDFVPYFESAKHEFMVLALSLRLWTPDDTPETLREKAERELNPTDPAS